MCFIHFYPAVSARNCRKLVVKISQVTEQHDHSSDVFAETRIARAGRYETITHAPTRNLDSGKGDAKKRQER